MAIKIIIETIPHDKQRYETVGDWWYGSDGTIHITVSDMGDYRKEACVAVHELCEMLMCRELGISQQQVDDFDREFEARRPEGDTSEPGDDPAAPYVRQHSIATAIERLLATELGLSWKRYDEAVNAL